MAKSKKPKARKPPPSNATTVRETIEVPAGVFKNTCLALMDEVHSQHKEVVITKYGAPVAKLVPPDVEAPSAFGFLRGTLVAQGDIVSPDHEAWGDLA